MAFLRYKDGHAISYLATLVSLLIATAPAVNYYFKWYITILPVIVIAYTLFKPNILFQRLVGALFLALLFVVFQYWTVYRRAGFITNIRNGMMAFVPIVTAFFLYYKADKRFLKDFMQVLVLLMIVTSLTTIIGVEIYPDACRSLANSNETEQAVQYLKMNIGGFDFIYAIVVVFPALFWLIRNTKGVLKIINIAAIFVFIHCVYKSAYSTALLLTIVALLFVAIERNAKLRPYLIALLVAFLLFSGTGLLSRFLLYLSNVVESEYVSDRILQVSLLVGGTDIQNISTATSTGRLELFQQAIDGFKSSPVFGHNMIEYSSKVLSGHSAVLDILSASGIMGLSLCVYVFYLLFKKVVLHKRTKTNPYVRSIWILFILSSATNPSGFYLVYTIIFPVAVCLQRFSIKGRQRYVKQ